MSDGILRRAKKFINKHKANLEYIDEERDYITAFAEQELTRQEAVVEALRNAPPLQHVNTMGYPAWYNGERKEALEQADE